MSKISLKKTISRCCNLSANNFENLFSIFLLKNDTRVNVEKASLQLRKFSVIKLFLNTFTINLNYHIEIMKADNVYDI